MLAAFSVGGPSPSADPKVVGGHQAHIVDMVEAVRDGHEPKLNGAAARPALALVLAILESAASGQEATVAR